MGNKLAMGCIRILGLCLIIIFVMGSSYEAFTRTDIAGVLGNCLFVWIGMLTFSAVIMNWSKP